MIEPPNSAGWNVSGKSMSTPFQRFAHEAMACTFELIITGEERRYAEQAARAAFDELDRLERELSRFIEHSDVARISGLAANQPLRVGIDVFDCLQLAGKVYAETNGAFDVTVGAPPADDAHLEPAGVPAAGMDLIELNPVQHTVTVRADGVTVDLGGIGKGYALDRMAGLMRQWSIGSALLHAGHSTVLALSDPSSGRGWPIGLRDPVSAAPPESERHPADCGKHESRCDAHQVAGWDRFQTRLNLTNAALSGSGRFLHGQHIIDPRTEQPAKAALTAWALTPCAALADALSTAFMVMSVEEVAGYCLTHADVSAALALPSQTGMELVTFGPAFVSPPVDGG